MTGFKADVRAAMVDTIARFLDAEPGPARGWTTPRDGAERLAALLLDAAPTAVGPAAAPMLRIGPLPATRSLHQLRQQEARPLLADVPLPSWAACADDHCRTVRHCVHGHAAGPAPATCRADSVSASQEAVTIGTVELTPVG